jgi:hypothetical protein
VIRGVLAPTLFTSVFNSQLFLKDPKPANTTVLPPSSHFMQEQRKSPWIQKPKIPELQIETIIA